MLIESILHGMRIHLKKVMFLLQKLSQESLYTVCVPENR